jgi:hypothetical protein
MTYHNDGRRGLDLTENDRYWAEKKREQLEAQDAERRRNHAGWLRLCGMTSPIGKLSDR